MTTQTVPTSAAIASSVQSPVATDPASRSRARQSAGDRWWRPVRRTISSEWIKLRTVRSTAFALAVAVLGLVLMAAFAAVGSVVADSAPQNASGGGPLGGALAGIPLAELAVAVLGVLVVTGEYGSRLIRVTLAANPRRWPVAVAKAVVVAGTVFVTTFAGVLAAFATTALVLSTEGIPVSLAAPGALGALLAGPVYLAGISVLAVGFGWILRSTAGALAVLFVVLYVLPVVGFVLPAEVAATVVPLLPGNAGNAMMQLATSGLLSPGAGFAVFTGYAIATIAAAVVVLRRRDA
jgi:ABC-type transport system involved in multi-copper enzyme maturation permease subunit